MGCHWHQKWRSRVVDKIGPILTGIDSSVITVVGDDSRKGFLFFLCAK